MTGEGAGNLPAILEVPEVQVQVRPGLPASIPDKSAPAERVAAVGGDGDGENCSSMALAPAELPTRRDVPDPKVRVGSSDDDPRAVRCGRQAIDTVVGADPPSQLAPGGDVPDADRP